jgi:hypothetical protein
MKKLIYVISEQEMIKSTIIEIGILKKNYNIFLLVKDIKIKNEKEIKELIGNDIIYLKEIFDITKSISDIKPDIIHFKEIPELSFDYKEIVNIYDKDRKYLIIESPYKIEFKNNKLFFPDKFIFHDIYNNIKYLELNIPFEFINYNNVKNIDNKLSIVINYKDDNIKHIKNIINNIKDYNIKICFSTKDNEEQLYNLFSEEEIEKYMFIQYDYIIDKNNDDIFYWDNVSRYIGYKYSNSDWVLFINSDEIIDIEEIIQKIMDKNTPDVCTLNDSDSPLLMKNNLEIDFTGDRYSTMKKYTDRL